MSIQYSNLIKSSDKDNCLSEVEHKITDSAPSITKLRSPISNLKSQICRFISPISTRVAILMVALIFSTTSCKKFVEEELVATLTQEYYESDQGLEDLVKSAYSPLRWKFNGEQSYALYNFGDDEFILGDQFNFIYYNTYDPVLGANEGLLNGLWINNYDGINRCNIGIEKIPSFTDGSSKLLGNAALRTQRVAELRFLRAYYYFELVQQFGGLPIVTLSSNTVVTDFPRSTVAEVYNLIFSDLQYAKNNLAPNPQTGRATQASAQHFIAKAYLTRGSAVADQRGQKPTDLDSAAFYAEAVIKGGKHILESDYMNLFNGIYPAGYPNVSTPPVGQNGSAPSGDYSKTQASNNSKEVILAAQFINNLTVNGRFGNTVHLYFIMQYDLGIPGLARNADNFNGRPFRRLGPSDYTINLYDRKNDSRFYKSFRTAYYANTPAGIPMFTAANAPNPSLVGKPKYGVGDTAALFIVNDRTKPLLSSTIAKYRYGVYARYYQATPTGPIINGFTPSKFLTLIKHLDPVRVTPNFNEPSGVRNGILARLGETYLIAAEAYGRKGDYPKALTFVNTIRTRAAYREGEFKNPQTWMFDGGVKGDVSSTAMPLQATDALFTTNAPTENYPASVVSTQERFIHFVLNERTRELCGELYRWQDLVRTETLFNRVKLFNKDATSIQTYSKLRPIPQQQIDLTTSGGQAMTGEQKKAYQNPGY